jgi:hypothetical protein
MHRTVTLVFLASGLAAGVARANPVHGKLELPAPPERPAPSVRGFVERVENPKKPIQPINITPHLLIVLESDSAKVDSPGQVKWELSGESFNKPVLGVPAGAQVVVKNTSNTARNLVAVEDGKLIGNGLVNPKIGEKSFTVPAEPKVYTITDKDAPHLVGKVVVVTTPYVANVELVGGVAKFELDVPEGSYKARIFYKDRWLEQTETITVEKKGKSEPTIKITSLGTEKK